MTILFLGAFGMGALENFYVKAFQQFPVTIETYDITKSYYDRIDRSLVNKVVNKIRPSVFFHPVNTCFLSYIEKKKFDIILVFKGLTLFPASIEQLKKHCRLLCCYNPDHPFEFYSSGSGNNNILASIPFYDVYINYAAKITSELKERFKIEAATVPFGYDDSSLDSVSWKGERLDDKILFAGAYDSERADFLKNLGASGLTIYGDQKWSTRTSRFPELKSCFTGKSLYGDEYKSAIKTALGTLNLLRAQNRVEGSHNMRTFEVPGYGGLLISNRTTEQSNFFEEGKEAVYFDSIEELKEKIAYLRKHPAEVRAIKSAAKKRSIDAGYSYTHRSREMYNILTHYLK